jgi:hypothetical protein
MGVKMLKVSANMIHHIVSPFQGRSALRFSFLSVLVIFFIDIFSLLA